MPGLPLFSPSAITLATLGAVFLGLLSWWFVRKRRQRLWLPTMRIIQLEERRLPRLRVMPPPWLSFLCFVLAALALSLFSARPSSSIPAASEPRQGRIHILADMSASVAAHVDIKRYAADVSALMRKLQRQGLVTVSTSHSLEVKRAQDPEELRLWLEALGFHRAGIKLGDLIHQQMEELGGTERLLIVSDGDRYSWGDLNWQFLAEEMEVLWVPVSADLEKPLANLYIDSLRYQAGADVNIYSWDVELARTEPSEELSGELKAFRGEQLLASGPFKFVAKRDRLSVTLSWPSSLELRQEASEPLRWELATTAPNALVADDTFRILARASRQDLLLVGEARGEMFLEDPLHHLDLALVALGYQVKRIDRLPSPVPPDLFALPLWILQQDDGMDLASLCPEDLVTRRLANLSMSDAQLQQPLPKIWLAPASANADFQGLCWCLDKLAISKVAVPKLPIFCEDVHNAEQWAGVLASLGAKQIGGELGNAMQAVAWHLKHSSSGSEVLAFTVPLQPQAGGLSFAGLPLLVRMLLSWQGLWQGPEQGHASDWPRLANLASTFASDQTSLDKAVSNIPVGESRLAPPELELMPPSWSSVLDVPVQATSPQQEQQDPEPWLRLCAGLVVAATVIEVSIRGLFALLNFSRRLPAVRLLGLGLLLFVQQPPRAAAKVQVAVLAPQGPVLSVGRLARELNSRTSIDLDTKVLQYSRLDDSALAQPWLFAHSPAQVSDASGKLDRRLASWIRRGGLLIIENVANTSILPQLTEGRLNTSQAGEGWQVIPPDHELMRSFHLLDTLPSCMGQTWQSLHYDGRMAIVAVPLDFIAGLGDTAGKALCPGAGAPERSVRAFINLLMVALATDYKKDQIHLPEILKRLR